MSQGLEFVSDPWRLCERTHISDGELWDSNIHLTTSGYFIDYGHSMLCLDDTKMLQPEVKGKHIALLTPPHPNDGVLFTEPLIIPVHLSGSGIRQLLLLLDSVTNVPF